MQRILVGAVLLGALVWPGEGRSVADQAQTSLSVAIDGLPPGTTVEVAMNVGKSSQAGPGSTSAELAAAMNQGKFSGTADPQGTLSGVLEIAAVGKIQVRVLVDEQCPDKKVRVYLVSQGQEPPPECDRRALGWFWLHKVHRLTIHVATHTLTTDSGGLLQNPLTYVAGGVLTAGAIVVSSGGGSNNTTGGTSVTPGNVPTAANPTPSQPALTGANIAGLWHLTFVRIDQSGSCSVPESEADDLRIDFVSPNMLVIHFLTDLMGQVDLQTGDTRATGTLSQSGATLQFEWVGKFQMTGSAVSFRGNLSASGSGCTAHQSIEGTKTQ